MDHTQLHLKHQNSITPFRETGRGQRFPKLSSMRGEDVALGPSRRFRLRGMMPETRPSSVLSLRHPSAEGGSKGSVEAVTDGPRSHQAIPTRARWATDENARGSAVCDAECLPCDVATWRTRIFRASKLVVELWPLSALLSALCSLFTPHPPRGPWPPVCPPVVPMVVPPTSLHAFVEASFISVGLPVGHYPSEG